MYPLYDSAGNQLKEVETGMTVYRYRRLIGGSEKLVELGKVIQVINFRKKAVPIVEKPRSNPEANTELSFNAIYWTGHSDPTKWFVGGGLVHFETVTQAKQAAYSVTKANPKKKLAFILGSWHSGITL